MSVYDHGLNTLRKAAIPYQVGTDLSEYKYRVIAVNEVDESVNVQISKPNTPKTFQTTSPATPNDEFVHGFEAGVKKFKIWLNGDFTLRARWDDGDDFIEYNNGVITEDNIHLLAGVNEIKMKVNRANATVNIIEWT